MAKIGETVKNAVNEFCPGTDLDIMGNYRRGAMPAHDVRLPDNEQGLRGFYPSKLA